MVRACVWAVVGVPMVIPGHVSMSVDVRNVTVSRLSLGEVMVQQRRDSRQNDRHHHDNRSRQSWLHHVKAQPPTSQSL